MPEAGRLLGDAARILTLRGTDGSSMASSLYHVDLEAKGRIGTYRCAVVCDLLDGMTLSDDGVLSGTLNPAVDELPVTVTCSDQSSPPKVAIGNSSLDP
jgi:hypothetical protein